MYPKRNSVDYDVPRPSQGCFTPTKVNVEFSDYQVPFNKEWLNEDKEKPALNTLSPLYSKVKKTAQSPSNASQQSSGIGTLPRQRDAKTDQRIKIKHRNESDSDYEEFSNTNKKCESDSSPEYDDVLSEEEDLEDDGIYNVPSHSNKQIQNKEEEDDTIYNVPSSTKRDEAIYDGVEKDDFIYNVPPSSNFHSFDSPREHVKYSTDVVIVHEEYKTATSPYNRTFQGQLYMGDEFESIDISSTGGTFPRGLDGFNSGSQIPTVSLKVEQKKKNKIRLPQPRIDVNNVKTIRSYFVPIMTLLMILMCTLFIICVICYIYIGFDFGYLSS